ncbi:multiubiquitin domain-containing protein [uncultured Microbacterium sp.]|uniref:multiubiquitin domain-containing protein n=1 Tax=uncultured Microbacterium sp. TaxID=191216 RepID=UPI002596593B|nr:multiubiquitin domain-containing protein [uncultured Microbacterium sp.]
MAPTNPVHIFIDSTQIAVPKRRLTGAQLRALTDPPAENIWLDLPDAQDHLVGHQEIVALKEGMRFFTDQARTIYVDKVPYQVRSASLTEDQLRAVTTPPVPETHGIWKDLPDELDDPISDGEIIAIADGDRFFTRVITVRIAVNRQPVTLDGRTHTGQQIKDSAIAQGVAIGPDFLLSRKTGQKFKPVGDDEQINVKRNDEFRALDGDDNS